LPWPHMPAIQLSSRDKIQEGDQYASPTSHGDRMEHEIVSSQWERTAGEEESNPIQQGRTIRAGRRRQDLPFDEVFESKVKDGVSLKEIVIRAGVHVSDEGR